MRDVDLPYGAGTLALITLDNGLDHTRPNTFGPGGLAVARRGASTRRSAATTSSRSASPASRSSSPSAPTSPALPAAAPTRDRRWPIAAARPRGVPQARATRRCRRSPSSTARRWAAASRSRCTATTARVSAGVPALALPEVFLGLVPGWGGAYLLPNLIGADERRHGHHREPAEPEPDAQAATQAFELGHRRRAVRAGRLPGAVAAWAAGVLTGEVTVDAARGRPRRGLGRGASRAAAAIADGKTARRRPGRRTGRSS